MHGTTPPDWRWSPPAPPAANGHDLQLGQTLGLLLAANDRQTRALERMAERMEDLPSDIARAMPPATPPRPPRDPLSWRDWMQIVAAAAIVTAVVMGKLDGETARLLLKAG